MAQPKKSKRYVYFQSGYLAPHVDKRPYLEVPCTRDIAKSRSLL